MDKAMLLELADRCESGEVSFMLDTELADIAKQPEGLALPYTASIDAALKLVPKGMPWSVNDPANIDGRRSVFGYPSRCHAYVEGGPNLHNYGKTPALALCVASLRARAANA